MRDNCQTNNFSKSHVQYSIGKDSSDSRRPNNFFNISTQTYVGEDEPWTGILAAAAFAIRSTTNRQNLYSPGQLIFGRDMILPIKHRVDR